MNARGSRAKGRNWDNAVAKMLSEWYFGVPDALIRTHGSRGRKGFKDQVGDLGVSRSDLNKIWVLGVENKCRDRSTGPVRKGIQKPAWSIDDILQQGRTAPLFDYWEQCTAEADRGEKIPLLVLKRKYHKPVAGIRYAEYKDVVVKLSLFVTPPVRIYDSDLVLLRFDDFLRTDPDAWISRWRRLYERAE